ncbi:MAG: alpha/beta fold hydrolase [Propionibacteriaceae bacterium]
MNLHEFRYGDKGPLVVFCHGLFGQGKNWGAAARLLSDQYRCVMLDMPNHGRSPWTDVVDYPTMADAVANHIATHYADDLPLALVGHSMGGKIAMRIALTHPELVGRLVVADMAPAYTEGMSSFVPIFDALNALPLDSITRREQADALLAERILDPAVRNLLMQSLRQQQGKWQWMINLEGLTNGRQSLSEWPTLTAQYDGPVLILAGANSNYIRPEDTPTIKQLFPTSIKATIKDAGHWLHSEQPEAFAATVRSFLQQTD